MTSAEAEKTLLSTRGSWSVPPPLSEAHERVDAPPSSPSLTDVLYPPPSAIENPERALLETDRFIEREQIGAGGMSVVIRAFDRSLQRDVAVKLLSPDCATDEIAIARLVEEARIAGSLEHPHILPIYDLGIDDRGVRFLCMKLVHGETLESTLSWAGTSRLTGDFLATLLRIFLQVCDAVSYAHGRGVLHRDLKPSNVMIDDLGQVYVTDWGVARRTSPPPSTGETPGLEAPGAIMGTPRYMAPEQLWGMCDRMDERTDVFGLGATLYHILAGGPPHTPTSLSNSPLINVRARIRPPEEVAVGAPIPTELSRIALKAMSHNPADRYARVEDLCNDVERFQQGS